ncbi:hypothetical protein DPSP01_014792 [Paraphaeosphaeria sporulosa]
MEPQPQTSRNFVASLYAQHFYDRLTPAILHRSCLSALSESRRPEINQLGIANIATCILLSTPTAQSKCVRLEGSAGSIRSTTLRNLRPSWKLVQHVYHTPYEKSFS